MSTQNRHTVIPAAYCIFRDGGKVLLLRRFNTGYKNGWYTLPSGHVEANETALVAAVREAKEEVGVTIEPQDLRLVFTLHSKSEVPETHERVSLFYEVKKWRGKPQNAEPSKCDEVRWASISALPDKTIEEVRLAIVNVAKHQPYGEYGFRGEEK